MDFLAPQHLWLLAAVAVLAAAYVVRQWRPTPHAVRHPDLDLVATVAPRSAAWRRHLTAAAMLLGAAALVVGLARPAYAVERPRQQAVVVLALDVSLSMSATDVAPTRLAAAVDAATAFVEDAPADVRIGLVTFDSDPHTLVAPTADRTPVADALATLHAGKGTAAGDGLSTAVKVLEADAAAHPATGSGEPYQAVVLLADGASTQGLPLDEATDRAVDAEIPVFTIGYGNPDARIVVDGESRPAGAEPGALAEVATATGGTDYTATTGAELEQVYDQIGETVASSTEQRELTVAFALAALVALTVGLGCSMAWSPRLV